MREADQRWEQRGLSEEEIASYDAQVNVSAVRVLGDRTLRTIAQESARSVRNKLKIAWMLGGNVRPKPAFAAGCKADSAVC